MSIGNRLKQLRVLNDKTQEEIAKELGISRSAYSNYELDKREPTISVLKKVSQIYNIKIDDLVSNTVVGEVVVLDDDEKIKELTDETLKILLNNGTITQKEYDTKIISAEKRDEIVKLIDNALKVAQVFTDNEKE